MLLFIDIESSIDRFEWYRHACVMIMISTRIASNLVVKMRLFQKLFNRKMQEKRLRQFLIL